MVFTLTEDQEKAKRELLETINSTDPDDRFHTIHGPAGSGKTTLIDAVISEIPTHMTIGMTAPTHKAVKVQHRMACLKGTDGRADFRTIHSALGLVMVKEEGDEVLKRDEWAEPKYYDVMFVDESGMLDEMLLAYIIECPARKVIFIGDKYQISPVNSEAGEISLVFTEVDKVSALTKVVRQAEANPIRSLATSMRLAQDDLYSNVPSIDVNLLEDGSGINAIQRHEWVKQLLEIYKSEDFKADPDYCRAIAFTNYQVDYINEQIRKALHGQNVPEWLVGEYIVAQEQGADFKNSEEMRILEIEDHFDQETGIESWNIKMDSLSTHKIHRALVVKKNSELRFEDQLRAHADRARMDKANSKSHWKRFWNIKNKYNSFKHIYAMTAHKSQGSTFKETFVYTPDFLKFGSTLEVKQLLYVATTRSSFKTTFAI